MCCAAARTCRFPSRWAGLDPAPAARFEADLQSAIAQKVNGPLNELKTAFGGLEGLTGELESRLNIGADLLKGGKGFGPPGFKLPF